MEDNGFFEEMSARADALAFREEERGGVERLLSRLEPLAGSRVVEAGCGNGRLTVRLAEAVSRGGASGRVWALDPCPGMCAKCREAVEAGGWGEIVTVEEATAEGSAAPEGSWDVALFFRVWPHLADEEAAVERARRWLAPGGRLVVANLQGSAELDAMHARCGAAAVSHRMPPAAELAARLRQAGWNVVAALEGSREYYVEARAEG
jgi:ubiquinone/menaquinone biosynthesis C-methylase UbiE